MLLSLIHILNTDGHLRSVFFGRSETMTIKDGELDGGEFAHVYFCLLYTSSRR